MKLFEERVKPDINHDAGPLASVFHQYKVMHHGNQKFSWQRKRFHTAEIVKSSSVSRPCLREYIPGDLAWEHAFDWFEYLAGFLHCYENGEDWAVIEQRVSEGTAETGEGWGSHRMFRLAPTLEFRVGAQRKRKGAQRCVATERGKVA